MFGYVLPNYDQLTDVDQQRYRSYYCGLCKTLGQRYHQLSRLTLTYDMTFLMIILSSVYKKSYQKNQTRCVIHPIKPHTYRKNEITDYVADMNVLLAYHKQLDDWKDDHAVGSLLKNKILKSAFQKAHSLHPEKSKLIMHHLESLSTMEKNNELNPDVVANVFSLLMEEIFDYQHNNPYNELKCFGKSLGKFLYIMDACVDLKSDIKHQRYNPMVSMDSKNFDDVLNLLMADCIAHYEKLSINKDHKIIENILYSGIWIQYEMKKQKERKRKI